MMGLFGLLLEGHESITDSSVMRFSVSFDPCRRQSFLDNEIEAFFRLVWGGGGFDLHFSLKRDLSPRPCFCFADAGFVRQVTTLYFSLICDLLVVCAPSSFQKFGVRNFKCHRVKIELREQENEKL